MTSKPIKRTKKKDDDLISLSKYIAICGVASRRRSTEIIKKGEVAVNGKAIFEPGYKLMPGDVVQAQGQLISQAPKVYVLLNKPKDYITSVVDEKGRKTVMDLVQLNSYARLFPIGRLDRATTGLIVLTNDGDFAQKLSHPRYEIPKIYHVVLDKPVSVALMKKIGVEGIDLEDGHVNVDAIYYYGGEEKTNVVVELHSGKYRVVRRIFEELGFKIKKLDRVGYASLSKKGLRLGQWRHLTQGEVNFLKHSNNKKKSSAE